MIERDRGQNTFPTWQPATKKVNYLILSFTYEIDGYVRSGIVFITQR